MFLMSEPHNKQASSERGADSITWLSGCHVTQAQTEGGITLSCMFLKSSAPRTGGELLQTSNEKKNQKKKSLSNIYIQTNNPLPNIYMFVYIYIYIYWEVVCLFETICLFLCAGSDRAPSTHNSRALKGRRQKSLNSPDFRWHRGSLNEPRSTFQRA